MVSKKLITLEKQMLSTEKNLKMFDPNEKGFRNAQEIHKIATLEYWDYYNKYVDYRMRAKKGWSKRKKWIYKKD